MRKINIQFLTERKNREKWQMGKLNLISIPKYVHPFLFTALEHCRTTQQGYNDNSSLRFMLQVLAPNGTPGRESFSLHFHAFRPFTLSLLSSAPRVVFIPPYLQKQALEGKGQSRRLGIKDPDEVLEAVSADGSCPAV